tara:strand:- start:24 stop:848 length:825 start_codon:yes stop_codon:yes gene_type:complete
MNCPINNKSNMDIEELSPLIQDLASHVKGVMNINSMPAITLHDDPQNAEELLGKTAYYDPGNKVITVYVTNRHPKDIMRSISHELIHHSQNERGEFDNLNSVGEQGYAQNDPHLRNMEKEAYLKGNMCFRDWEDGRKRMMMESIHRQNSFKRRNKTMKIHKWKNNELNRLLMERFIPELKKINEADEKDLDAAVDAHLEKNPDATPEEVAQALGFDLELVKSASAFSGDAEPTGEPLRENKRTASYRKKVRAMFENILRVENKKSKKVRKARRK